jgi:hypothetical protein
LMFLWKRDGFLRSCRPPSSVEVWTSPVAIRHLPAFCARLGFHRGQQPKQLASPGVQLRLGSQAQRPARWGP